MSAAAQQRDLGTDSMDCNNKNNTNNNKKKKEKKFAAMAKLFLNLKLFKLGSGGQSWRVLA